MTDIIVNLSYNPKDIKDYDRACSYLLSLCKDNKELKVMNELLNDGSYNERKLFSDDNFNMKGNSYIEAKKRIGMAMLLLTNPETFNILMENNIVYFHGTNANSLPGILKNGICSASKINNTGENVKTGELSTNKNKGRNFISFTDVLDDAVDYSFIKPNEKNNILNLDFPIIFGTTKDSLDKYKLLSIPSDLPEIDVIDSFSLNDIRIIMVPSDKVDYVSNMLSSTTIKIMPIDVLKDKTFCYVDYRYNNKIYIFQDKYEDFKKKRNLELRASLSNSNYQEIADFEQNNVSRK